MTPLELIKMLAEILRGSVAKWKLPAEPASKKLSIYLQNIPADEFASDSFYPLICVELVGVEDSAEGTTAQVLLTLGTFDGDNQGWADNLNIAQKVRETILRNWIIKAAALELPLEFGVTEKVNDNFTFSNFLITYRMPGIEYEKA